MASWNEFTAAAPILARFGLERMDRTGMVMMGTLRKDGSPRVTPIEYFLFEGELNLGGMWQSKKMLDLVRDPRCALHSATSDKNGTQGDFKLSGRAVVPHDDAEELDRYLKAVSAHTGYDASSQGPFHRFWFDIHEVAFLQFGETAAAIGAELRADPGATVRFVGADPEKPDFIAATWKAAVKRS
ncbi:MAG: pyridoxamine 5'-phosphate oxidase family protein [Dehalococcoidia bacterium]